MRWVPGSCSSHTTGGERRGVEEYEEQDKRQSPPQKIGNGLLLGLETRDSQRSLGCTTHQAISPTGCETIGQYHIVNISTSIQILETEKERLKVNLVGHKDLKYFMCSLNIDPSLCLLLHFSATRFAIASYTDVC